MCTYIHIINIHYLYSYSFIYIWVSEWSSSVMSNCLRPHGLLCPWNFPGKSTRVGCRFLLQGIFLTQGSNPGLPHCRQMLYHLNHQGSPKNISLSPFFWGGEGKNTGVGCHSLLQEIFPTQGLNPGLPHCRQMLYHLSYQGSQGYTLHSP